MCYRYKNAADGKQALEKMNGFDLAGRQVMGTTKERERERETYLLTSFFVDFSSRLVLSLKEQQQPIMAIWMMKVRYKRHLFLGLFNSWCFTDSAGLSLNSLARAELMHKLAARQSDMMEEEYRQAEESSTTPTAPYVFHTIYISSTAYWWPFLVLDPIFPSRHLVPLCSTTCSILQSKNVVRHTCNVS